MLNHVPLPVANWPLDTPMGPLCCCSVWEYARIDNLGFSLFQHKSAPVGRKSVPESHGPRNLEIPHKERMYAVMADSLDKLAAADLYDTR
jgi:hypothetical protein